MRASWADRLLVAVDRHSPGARAAVLSMIPEALASRYAAGAVTGWLAMDDHLRVVRATASLLGPDALDTLQRDNFVRGFGQSTISKLIVPGIRLFGASGTALCRLVPRVYNFLTRECGTVSMVFGETGAGVHLVMSGLPPCARQDDILPRSLRNAMLACLDLVQAEGTAELDIEGLAGGEATVVVRAHSANALAQRRRVG